MPTYAFRCTKCQHEFEVTQSVNAPPVTKCEKCGAPVKKLFFPVGIQFKGAGFHINDYAKPAPKGEEKKADAPKTEPAPPPSVDTKAAPNE